MVRPRREAVDKAVNGAVDWIGCPGAAGPGNVSDPMRVLEQGPVRQLAPDHDSGGVSSIVGASESR
jgi:hypothetical protein